MMSSACVHLVATGRMSLLLYLKLSCMCSTIFCLPSHLIMDTHMALWLAALGREAKQFPCTKPRVAQTSAISSAWCSRQWRTVESAVSKDGSHGGLAFLPGHATWLAAAACLSALLLFCKVVIIFSLLSQSCPSFTNGYPSFTSCKWVLPLFSLHLRATGVSMMIPYPVYSILYNIFCICSCWVVKLLKF